VPRTKQAASPVRPEKGEITTSTGQFQVWNAAAEPHLVDAFKCKWKREYDGKGGSGLTLRFFDKEDKPIGKRTAGILNVQARVEPIKLP
jgi:hypothetical protein